MAELSWEPLWRMLGVLAALVAVLWLLLQWLKRRGALPMSASRIKLVSVIALGGRERIALIEADGVRVLVGVTAQHITPLWTSALPQSPSAGSFAEHLQQAIPAQSPASRSSPSDSLPTTTP